MQHPQAKKDSHRTGKEDVSVESQERHITNVFEVEFDSEITFQQKYFIDRSRVLLVEMGAETTMRWSVVRQYQRHDVNARGYKEYHWCFDLRHPLQKTAERESLEPLQHEKI